MPEREARSEAVRAAKPLRVGSATVLAVERVVVRSVRAGPGIWFAAVLQPYALVVRDAGGVRVYGVDERAVPLDRLRDEIPELDGLLAAV